MELPIHCVRYYDIENIKQTDKDTMYSCFSGQTFPLYASTDRTLRLRTRHCYVFNEYILVFKNYVKTKFSFTLRKLNGNIAKVAIFSCASFWRRTHASTDKTEKNEKHSTPLLEYIVYNEVKSSALFVVCALKRCLLCNLIIKLIPVLNEIY